MSQIAYNGLWAEAMEKLGKLVLAEEPVQQEVKPSDHFITVADFYFRYVQAFRGLEEAYDQIVHPQKRLLLREILDGVMGRVLELKNEMVELESSEFHYLDQITDSQKCSPAELEVPIPNYFTVERSAEIAQRRATLADILDRMEAEAEAEREAEAEAERKRREEEEGGDNSDDDDDDDTPRRPRAAADSTEDVADDDKPAAEAGGGEKQQGGGGEEKQMTKKEKEREKQEKARRKEQEKLQRQAEKERQEREDKERLRRAALDRGEAAMHRAAVTIQSLWRGWAGRRATARLRREELVFLGMMESTEHTPPEDNVVLQATKARRRDKQRVHERQYEVAIVTITDELWRVDAVTMADAMKEEIRQWINELFAEKGQYPDYPEEEEGGSQLIVEEKRRAEELAAGLEDEDASKKEPKDKKEGKKDKKDKKGKEGEGEEKPQVVHLKPSNFLADIDAGNRMFQEVWNKRDESKNFVQGHEDGLIRDMQRKLVEPELRLKVDVEMRLELEELVRMEEERKAAEAKGKKGKGGKAGGKGKKGGKKGKKDKKGGKGGKGGKKKKEEVDITADRPLEELYEELVREGLLIKVEPVKMRDYLGDYSYLGNAMRLDGEEVRPSLSDVRQVLTLFAILPLGSQTVHEKAPLTKAIFLTGPAGVGKKMLVHAVCQEVGANLFDLSPQNILGHYPGPDGLNMMLHMVFKVAKLMQPSVVWIGDADKMFNKKVPKEDKDLDVKRLKKDLPKVVKAMKAGERVLILGTSQDPTNTDIKAVAKVYGKILVVPGPDYSSRYQLWKQLIKKLGGQVTGSLDLSALSQISHGYTPGLMLQVIGSVLTEERRGQLDKRPLTAEEFVEPLSKTEAVTAAEKLLVAWDGKTPLGKKRAKAAKEKEEAAAEKAKGKKK